MRTCITPHHPPISEPFQPQEEFLLKNRELFDFILSCKFTLFTKQHYFTENRKEEKKISDTLKV